MGVRLFVGNLDYSVNESELREHFAPVGQPSQVALPVDRETGRPRGFAFVEFADRGVAEEVIRRFNGQPLKGRPLAISEARAREDRPFTPRPPGGGGGGPRPPMGGGAPGGGGPPRDSGGPPRPFTPRPPRTPDFDDSPGGRPQRRAAGGGAAGKARGNKPERGGPRGPIRERGGGRVLDIDDSYDEESGEAAEDGEEFDDFATSARHDEEEPEKEK